VSLAETAVAVSGAGCWRRAGPGVDATRVDPVARVDVAVILCAVVLFTDSKGGG